MAQQVTPVEVMSWSKGLVTEANPLSFPEGASIDEENFVLNQDGTRSRRLGLDLESGGAIIDTGIAKSNLYVKSFLWENAGGVADVTLLIVQVGNFIHLFIPGDSVSAGYKTKLEIVGAADNAPMSFANSDGKLIIVCNIPTIEVIEYDNVGITLKRTTGNLRIRDFFGVEDIIGSKDLNDPTYLNLRPDQVTDSHIYNLRNQTFGEPRLNHSSSAALADPIKAFFTDAKVYPSNSDNLQQFFYPDTSASDKRTKDQFWPDDMKDNKPPNFRSPTGMFIIDLLDRGGSRLKEVKALNDRESTLEYPLTKLPADKTSGGASVIAGFAGRIFYAGFSSDNTEPDSRSPVLSSYIAFSRLIKSPTDAFLCYQEGDPTSKEAPDLLDTDGGLIRIDGASGINYMVSTGSGLLVLAENGVWVITGGNEYGFTASTYKVTKISNVGCMSPGSVVMTESSLAFWSSDAIQAIDLNSLALSNISTNTIQTLYDTIPINDKLSVTSSYDSFKKEISWCYGHGEKTILIFNAILGAFTKYRIKSTSTRSLISPAKIPPMLVRDFYTDTMYICRDINTNFRFKFGHFTNEVFKDWGTTDSKAYIHTGWFSGGDLVLRKELPYLLVHLRDVSTGLFKDDEDEVYIVNDSSCKASILWNWAKDKRSNRWSREFEVYRKRNNFFWDYDDFFKDFEVITSKTKLRGSGRVLSLRFETSEGKACDLVGWSMILGVS